MPRFEPFAGVRYQLSGDLTDVMAPPYDVVTDERRAALAAQDAHNAVHLDLPVDQDGKNRYQVACETLRAWQDDGTLVTDDQPGFYLYRMSYTTPAGEARSTTGVIGALELSPPGTADVLPHEETTPKAKSDRLEMLRSCSANLSPIWGLSIAPGLSDALAPDGPATAYWDASDGVRHELWRVDDTDRIESIRSLVEAEPVLIADGHHRYQTSLQYRDERRGDDAGDGPWDLTMALIVELVEPQLDVRAIHRVIPELPDDYDLTGKLAEWFELLGPAELTESTTVEMREAGELVLLTPDGATRLRPREERFADVRPLDTIRIQTALPELEFRYEHSVDRLADDVASGRAAAGVLVRPVTVEQIAEVAHADELMPPKTTFFNPKPSTGAVYRLI